MGKTEFSTIDQLTSSAKIVASLPSTPASYYGFTAGQEIGETEWKGGELAFLTTSSKFHVQINTSGTTAAWYLIDEAWATTTSTSTSTSTSSSTSSSTSTSSTTTGA